MSVEEVDLGPTPELTHWQAIKTLVGKLRMPVTPEKFDDDAVVEEWRFEVLRWCFRFMTVSWLLVCSWGTFWAGRLAGTDPGLGVALGMIITPLFVVGLHVGRRLRHLVHHQQHHAIVLAKRRWAENEMMRHDQAVEIQTLEADIAKINKEQHFMAKLVADLGTQLIALEGSKAEEVRKNLEGIRSRLADAANPAVPPNTN